MKLFRKSLTKRASAMALALVLLSACGNPAGAKKQTPSQGASSITLAVTEPQTALEYTEMALTAEGIAVEPGAAYYLPLGEGKYVPADDTAWKEYLDGNEFSALENFSMPFVAVAQGETALVYIMGNPYRASVQFAYSPDLTLTLVGEETTLDPLSTNTVRVYTTENDAFAVANVYKSYVTEMRDILTLAEKAKQNPNIEKLYGAPHIYLWGDFLLSDENIKWPEFRKVTGGAVLTHVSKVLAGTADDGMFAETLGKLSGQDYVDRYQKSVLLRGLSVALAQENFYDSTVFTKSNAVMQALLAKGTTIKQAERIELHKQALAENLPGIFEPVAQWYNDASVDILDEMKAAGIDTAWIGLNSWEQAYNKPQLTTTAIKNGYLVGPYDSYHSIHEPGKEQWITAKFADTSLYETATVEDKNGKKIGGFQNTGRKLNPTLAMSSVTRRVQEILGTGVQFNSWFVDCDATGEVYDDYSPAHATTKQQDVAARLERMDYIAKEHNMVVGSEGGNDFAANSIAFAHGIELPSFSWMDEDMKANKDSEYYLGKYYSASGGVPVKFAAPVPIKKKYRKLFLDMSYQIPLFKLVYNDSVITTYHWDWSTFKIMGESENRMLREILYNVPPMYHLDRTEWDSYKDRIVTHNAAWSAFSKKAISQKMTAFGQLTDDRLVQMTRYGSDLQAIANFSDAPYQHDGTALPPRSVLMIDGGDQKIYTP